MIKGVLLRLGCLVASLTVCFVLAELLGRQSLSYVARSSVSALGGSLEADPELLVEYTARGRRLVPHADVVIHNHYISGLDVDVKTNALGLRDPERSEVPPEGTERVILLGDSIVIQDYLPSEQTLARLLEKQFQSPTGPAVEVVNAGLSNMGIDEEYQVLSEIMDRLHPHAVLLSFYLNDSRPAWGFSGEIGTRRGWLRKHSIVVDAIIRELEVRKWLSDSQVDRFGWMQLVDQVPWRSDRSALQKMIDAAPYDWGSAWSEEGWGVVEQGLQRIKSLTERYGARFGVIMMPVRYQVEADYVEDAPQRRLAEILDRMGVPHHSLLAAERAHRQEDIFYDWCHPTERGNRIIAPEIAEFISRELISSSKAK